MEKDCLSSPVVECGDIIQGSVAPEWYCNIRSAVRGILFFIVFLSMSFVALPVYAAELPDVSSGDYSLRVLSEEVSDPNYKEGYFYITTSKGKIVYIPEGYKNYFVADFGNYCNVYVSNSYIFEICQIGNKYKFVSSINGRIEADVYNSLGVLQSSNPYFAVANGVCEHGKNYSTYHYNDIVEFYSNNYVLCGSESDGDSGGDLEGDLDDKLDEELGDPDVLYPMYDSYEEFMESPLYVTRYENEVLRKLEFCQYAFAMVIALLFLLIFKKK